MKYLQILFAACFGAILLLNPNPALAKKPYAGADAGYLVYSVSSLGMPMIFSFDYHRTPADAEPKLEGSLDCRCQGLLVMLYPGKMDYKGVDHSDEHGNVSVEKLPPGQYEVYSFVVTSGSMAYGGTWTPKKQFSMPFTIQAGQATYIGNFARRCCGDNDHGHMGLGYFVISDKSDRDLAIARTKEPALPPVTDQVFDVTKLDLPNVFSSEP